MNRLQTTDAFGPYTETDTVKLVEVEVPPNWRVRVIEGTDFQVRLSSIEAESDDEGDSVNVSPNQSKAG
jgi:hypothetical protein